MQKLAKISKNWQKLAKFLKVVTFRILPIINSVLFFQTKFTSEKQEFQRNKNLNLCYYYMKYLNYRETLYSMYDHYSSLILFKNNII